MTTQSISDRPGFFARMWTAMMTGAEAAAAAQGRSNLYREMDAMSDAQLAEIGLKREDIARYVFRDIINI